MKGWNEKTRRWKKMYKGELICIAAKKLNKHDPTYNGTLTAFRRLYAEECERIDAQKAIAKFRPNEVENLSELENIEASITATMSLINSTKDQTLISSLVPAVEQMRKKAAKIKHNLTLQKIPALTDALRNPLDISPKGYEKQSEDEAIELLIEDAEDETDYDNDFDKSYPTWVVFDDRHIDPKNIDFDEFIDYKTEYFNGINTWALNKEEKEKIVLEAIERENEKRNKIRSQKAFQQKNKIFEKKKETIGFVGDFERGRIAQRVEDKKLIVPQSKRLSDIIQRYTDYQKFRHAQKKIKAGQLLVNTDTVNYYFKWAQKQGVNNVDFVATMDHVDSYLYFIANQQIEGIFSDRYAKKMFDGFKRFYQWMFNEKIIKEPPPWIMRGDKDDKYKISIERKIPETMSLPILRQVVESATPYLRLFILLSINCGFGQSEIGQLEKDEFDSEKGVIVHKRVKTRKHDRVPTMTYKLWGRTKELLVEQLAKQKTYPKRSGTDHLLLKNQNGNPLWYEWFDDKYHKADNISCMFKRHIQKLKKQDKTFPNVTFYMFRRTVSTEIFNSKEYCYLDWLWLDHSPTTTSGRSYTVPHETILDECLKWLEDHLFGNDHLEQECKNSENTQEG